MSEVKLLNRKGWFRVTFKMVDQQTERFAEFLNRIQFVPLRVEARYDENCFAYYGCSNQFDVSPDHQPVPEYSFELEAAIDEKTDEVCIGKILVTKVS